MVSADTKRWKELFGKMLALHRLEWDDALSRFYFDALKDLDWDDVQITGEELMRTSTFFPKAAEWRSAIGVRRFNARRERDRQLANRRISATVHCERCNDTGMRPSDANPDRYTHCECRDTNPNRLIARARERMADEEAVTPQVPAHESTRILETVKDFKRLSSGD